MSTQGQWEEQLIAEWMSLQGYFVETNVILIPSKSGGRNEADVVAARVEQSRVTIRHIEVGSLAAGFGKNLSNVSKNSEMS